jgi:hypothetical protein
MTKAQIQTAVRNLSRNASTAAGTLFPADNVFLDFLIDMAAEAVVIDLVDWIPDVFLATEDIDLVANTSDYTLTAEWMQIQSIKNNVSGEEPWVLPYFATHEEFMAKYVGETDTDPRGWTLKGNTIVIMPTPSSSISDKYKVWFTKPEAAVIVTAGPTMIPRVAHRLIPIMCLILLSNVLEAKVGTRWEKLYAYWLEKINVLLHFRVQQQPKYLGGSFVDAQKTDSRDPAFFDRVRFLG